MCRDVHEVVVVGLRKLGSTSDPSSSPLTSPSPDLTQPLPHLKSSPPSFQTRGEFQLDFNSTLPRVSLCQSYIIPSTPSHSLDLPTRRRGILLASHGDGNHRQLPSAASPLRFDQRRCSLMALRCDQMSRNKVEHAASSIIKSRSLRTLHTLPILELPSS